MNTTIINKTLAEIASIKFGPYMKGSSNGDAKYLLASHFDKQYQLTKFELSFVNLNEKQRRNLLEPNDVILAGKGSRIFAWAYDEKIGPTIASSLFYVIKTNREKINGKYLACYLNSPLVQQKLKAIAGGFKIPSLPKKELIKISIVIPSIDAQMKFVEMARLLDEDVSLAEDLLKEKSNQRHSVINGMIAKMTSK